jgi:hypothetical protein
MPGIALSSDSIDNPNILATVIKEILHTSDADTTDITVHAGEYHEDWSADAPCPYCGGERFAIMCANHEIYEIDENGHLVFIEKGDSVGPNLSYFCWECEEVIQKIPYRQLL